MLEKKILQFSEMDCPKAIKVVKRFKPIIVSIYIDFKCT